MGKVKASIPSEETAHAGNEGDLGFPIDETVDTETTSVAVRGDLAVGKITGELSAKDIPTPILSVVYGVGDLAAKFNPGDLVLDKEHFLVGKTQPLNVILVSADVYWKEYLDQAAYQAGIRPRTFESSEQVLAAGGTVAFGADGSKPSYKRAMTVNLLIEKPEGTQCYLFFVPLLGKQYAPARWFVDKTAYARKGNKGVGVEIVKQGSFALQKRGLCAGKWQITTGFEDMGPNKVIVPSIKLVGQFSDAELTEVKSVVCGGAA